MALVSINFIEQRQEQDLWCWAAVAASVSSYYGRATAQCTVVMDQPALPRAVSTGGRQSVTDRAISAPLSLRLVPLPQLGDKSRLTT